VFEQLLAGGPAHAIVMDLDRSGTATRPTTGGTLRERLAGSTAAERERVVRTLVTAEIARIMDSPGTAVESTTPLADVGFDSLMALELRNSLAAAAALDLPASFVFDYPTADALTARLLHLVCRDPATTPSAASVQTSVSSLINEVSALSDADVEAELEAFARTFLNTR
jgi:hypothetical protein